MCQCAISHRADVVSNSDSALQAAVFQQPVSVGICATDAAFASYASGVLTGTCCASQDHAVLVVGYGTDPTGGDYWLIKNCMTVNLDDCSVSIHSSPLRLLTRSLGLIFGEAGYFRLGRGAQIWTGRPVWNSLATIDVPHGTYARRSAAVPSSAYQYWNNDADSDSYWSSFVFRLSIYHTTQWIVAHAAGIICVFFNTTVLTSSSTPSLHVTPSQRPSGTRVIGGGAGGGMELVNIGPALDMNEGAQLLVAGASPYSTPASMTLLNVKPRQMWIEDGYAYDVELVRLTCTELAAIPSVNLLTARSCRHSNPRVSTSATTGHRSNCVYTCLARRLLTLVPLSPRL